MKNSRKVKRVAIKQNWSARIGKFQPRHSTIMRASDLRWAQLLTNATEAREKLQLCIYEGVIEPLDVASLCDDHIFDCIRQLKKICDEADKETP